MPCGYSALQDRRFEPMAHREVASLSCTVSLLCAFERAKSWRDWSVGVHGLIIEFFGAPTPCLQLWLVYFKASGIWSGLACLAWIHRSRSFALQHME